MSSTAEYYYSMEECPRLLVETEVPESELLDTEVFGIEVVGIEVAGIGIAQEGVNKEVAEKEVPNGSTEAVESLETAGVEG